MSQDDSGGDTVEQIKVWSSTSTANANSTNITRLDIQITNQAYFSQFVNSFSSGSISSSPSGSNHNSFSAIWDARRGRQSIHLVNFILSPDPSISSYTFGFTVSQASLTFFCSGACNYALIGVQPDGSPYCSTGSLGYVPIITTDFADFILSQPQGTGSPGAG